MPVSCRRFPHCGTGFRGDADGFTYYDDNWNSSLTGRPFSDLNGAREYLLRKTAELHVAAVRCRGRARGTTSAT